MPQKDRDALLEMPGAKATAGTLKVKKETKESFLYSIGQGVGASGGQGQYSGTGGSGDPTISYPVGPTLAPDMGRAGAFGTPFHKGKQPTNYDVPIPTDSY